MTSIEMVTNNRNTTYIVYMYTVDDGNDLIIVDVR